MDRYRELRRLHLLVGKANTISLTLKKVTIMKNYLKPEFDIYEIVAERGYGDSIGLPGFGGESDELVY